MPNSYLLSKILVCGLFACSNMLWSQAVSTTNDGIVTQWDNPVTVIPNTLRHNDVDFPAHTITVHGANANQLFKRWRSEMNDQARDLSGRRPVIAKGVVTPSISSSPINMLAQASGDRREPFARLTVAFARNDTTPLVENSVAQERYMRDLAVRFNQALIQEEIADKQHELARVQRRLDRSDSNERKTKKKIERAEKKLQRANDRRIKAEKKKAEDQGELIGLQRAMEVSQNERDKRRVIRARRKISDHESDILKYMEREMRYQQDIDEYNAELPAYDQTQRDRSSEVEQLEKEINALRSASDHLEQRLSY